MADRANTDSKWKFHFFVYLYLITLLPTRPQAENRKLGHDWRLRGSVELSRVGQWEHSHDPTQLNWSRCENVQNSSTSWVELSWVGDRVGQWGQALT